MTSGPGCSARGRSRMVWRPLLAICPNSNSTRWYQVLNRNQIPQPQPHQQEQLIPSQQQPRPHPPLNQRPPLLASRTIQKFNKSNLTGHHNHRQDPFPFPHWADLIPPSGLTSFVQHPLRTLGRCSSNGFSCSRRYWRPVVEQEELIKWPMSPKCIPRWTLSTA